MKNKQITVVIPTLGKKKLHKNLKILSDNIYVKQIIISLPKNSISKNFYSNYNKVKLIYSKLKGQVYQRISVQKFISTKYVLYMDDDIFFDKLLVNKLLETKIRTGSKTAIGPVYFEKKTKKKIHPLNGNILFLIKKIIHYLLFKVPISKKRMGQVSLCGSCYGVDGEYIKKNPFKTSWLPGGCFIISKKYMINYNYFPVDGKAFCEDLILSLLLRKKKIKLYIDKNVKIFTDSPKKLIKSNDILEYLNGHKIYCSYAKLNNYRVKIWRQIFEIRLKINNFLN